MNESTDAEAGAPDVGEGASRLGLGTFSGNERVRIVLHNGETVEGSLCSEWNGVYLVDAQEVRTREGKPRPIEAHDCFIPQIETLFVMRMDDPGSRPR